MQIELKNLQRTLGLTFVYVTHDQEEALSMSDLIIVMNQGRIEQFGAPDEIYHRPTTSFVANFLGESNIFEGEVVAGPRGGEDRGVEVDIGGRRLHASLGTLSDVVAGQKVLISLRIESMSLGGDAEGLANRIEGQIAEAIFLGTAWEYVVMLGDSFSLKCWVPAGRNRSHLNLGDKVTLGWAADDMVLVR